MALTIRIFSLLSLMMLTACTGKPERVIPVSPFDLQRYLGTWYEIARLDHSFERGLTDVSATYSLNQDGSVKVVNKGWDAAENKWSEAIGKAKFVEDPKTAHLKVSFFGPFYGSYVVFYLEDDYSVALVSGYNTHYFWLLSRTKTLSQEKIDVYLKIVKQAGFATESLIFPNSP
jgi:apolipoprotein D and lipocalin family protein